MLNLEQINAQIAKGDPKLKDVYLKLKKQAESVVDDPPELIVTTASIETFPCSKCSKLCASNAGLKAHERKCKA